ncbi:MAG: thioredoxin [Endomicrobium sp.]|jgi:thioredoxin 1|nr:thioredoxin [Endomicrobium sp.]
MVVEINENNFQQEVSFSDKLVLVDFWAPWCGPCKMFSRVVEELSLEYEDKIKIGKVNTDENLSLSARFQISSIPCLILFKGGKTLQKAVGFKSKNEVKKIIDTIIV